MNNVIGTLKIGSTNIDNASLNLRRQGDNLWFSTSVSNGNFDLHLEDGTYTAIGFWDNTNGEYTSLEGLTESTFTISQGVAIPSNINLVVPAGNVNGTLHAMNNQVVDKAWLHIHRTNGNPFTSYSVQVKNSSFSLYLPDGSYRVDGYWDEVTGSDVSLNVDFIVDNGVVVQGPLNLVVKTPNVHGTFQLPVGTPPITEGNVSLSNTSKDGPGIGAPVKDNKFDLYLPDGNYIIEGVVES